MKRHDKYAISIFAAIVVFVVGVVVFRVTIGQAQKYDRETLCLTEQPLSAHTVLLVDKTDPLTDAQGVMLRRVVNKLKERISQYERFSIYLITNEVSLFSAPLISLCNPGRGDEANPIYENPRKVQKYFEEHFGQPIDGVVQQLLDQETAPNSPIMEIISHLDNLTDFSSKVKARTLVIFSDMLQNVKEYSHYRHSAEFDFFKSLPYGKRVMASLRGVRVIIYYLNRADARGHQDLEHIQFWKRYFDDAGAKSVTFSIRSGNLRNRSRQGES